MGRDALAELCEIASTTAAGHGHELDAWVAPPRDGAIERRARCRRCGRVVYVRLEDTIKGMAGAALRERCTT